MSEGIVPEKNESELQRNARLISNWYQSYYMWSSTVMASSLNSRISNHSSQISNIPFCNNAEHSSSHVNNSQSILNHNNQAQTQSPENRQNAPVYKIPSLSRRFAAECFDAVYIQCLKVTLALIFINYTDLISEDTLNIYDILDDILSEDNLNNIRLPFELFFLEIAYVLISVIFESYCIYWKGYTPGKYFLNLKIVSCNEINELATPNRVRITPGTQLSLKSIFIRTSLKNFSIVFLFPTILFFLLPAFVENGQTTYDKISESIVVESTP